MSQPSRTKPGSFIKIEYTKWPRQLHYSYRMRALGVDEYGIWGCCDAGEQVHKAGKLAFVRSDALLCLVPRVGCWSASWYPPTEERLEVYIDINTQPVWLEDAVTMIDLDLDVLRARDGTVEVLDEDEFNEHRVAYDYPPEIVTLARTAVAETVALAQIPFEPFDQAWRDRYAKLHER